MFGSPTRCDKLQMKLVIKYKSFNFRQVENKVNHILKILVRKWSLNMEGKDFIKRGKWIRFNYIKYKSTILKNTKKYRKIFVVNMANKCQYIII